MVRGPERLKADEVVPNLDKASPPKPMGARRKGQQLSILERDCRSEAHQIAQRRRQAEDDALGGDFVVQKEHAHAKSGLLTVDKALNRTVWNQPGKRAQLSLQYPSAWEKYEMRPLIERHPVLEGKGELNAEDVARLAKALIEDGIEQVGRTLCVDTFSSDIGSGRNAILLQAVRQGNAPEAKKALGRGADVNSRDSAGNTPLITAAAEGHGAIVALLLDAKADTRAKSADSNTALGVALLRGRSDVIEQLRAHQDATGAPMTEATIHEIREKDYLGNARPVRQAHPVEKLLSDQPASTAQVAEWLLAQSWPRMSDSRMAARVHREQEQHGWADLARNHEALEKRIEASRKTVGPILAELDAARKATFGGARGAPKDPKEAAGYQMQLDKLDQLPKQIDEAGKQLPKDVLTQLLISRAAKDAPVAIRLEGLRGGRSEAAMFGDSGASGGTALRKHRSDVFHQSYLRPKREAEETTGRLTLNVSHNKHSTTFGG
eukprot:TRINITY_DN26192_c0_g1_i2.p1 TRINITY_DN26192_c0_g1~~TRINITY_DN26192_c0_g1_i2.p1  ORF type:complete len:493 (+),score=75.78 TRINITY_DN26192_c0_g1_i2:164-1642(+)